jgi:hypothetical protein
MWTMLADTNGKMFDCFDVRPGQSAALVLGPPFTVRTDVRQAGNTVTIGLTITGRAGEFYSAKALVNDHLLPRRQQPALTIVDEEGNVLVTDRFQYG